ncbi:hypothetical protein KP79_PYT06792 [Mizuhopecten yessoensis]|uniref:Uncharacterized protein n=1 Tax=Mizuhopecten yessoensis TaxID=6573 RepID=A0A210QFV6_MIZYE|nr:hypothetical protein KP79_PYT06792 [Mizuhopecten yessoensis]
MLLLLEARQETETNKDFYEFIIFPMLHDDVSKCVKTDPLIQKLGKVLFHRLGKERGADIRGRLRNLARLLMELKKHGPNQSLTLVDFIKPSALDECITATRNICGVAGSKTLNGTQKLLKPALTSKLGELLKKVAALKRAQSIRSVDETKRKESEDFITLFDAEWTDEISSIARQSSSEAKYNKKDTLPLTRDLIKLKKHLDDQILILLKKLEGGKETERGTVRKLAEILLAKIISFNKRTSKNDERRPKVIKKRKPVVKRSAASVSEQSDSDQDAENKGIK